MATCKLSATLLIAALLLPIVAASADPARDAYEKGKACPEKKDYAAAIGAFTEAIRLDPKDTRAYRNRSIVYWNNREYDKSIADATQAIRLGLKDAKANCSRGLVVGDRLVVLALVLVSPAPAAICFGQLRVEANGLGTVRLQIAKKQKEAVAAIGAIGGADVFYDWHHVTDGQPKQPPPGPAWARNVLGDDFFASVVYVYFYGGHVSNAGLEHIDNLGQLQELYLFGSQVTDAGLEQCA